jgi:protein-tyrosine phosphatase
MAESVFTYMVKKEGLESRFYINSMATSTEEIGNPPHHGTVRKCREKGVPVLTHYATQLTREDYDHYDYLIGMDTWNIRNIMRIISSDPENKVHKLLEFADSSADIDDPWYTGDFETTYQDVLRGCEGLLSEIL